MNRCKQWIAAAALSVCGVLSPRAAEPAQAFRPPAVPLVTFDPYLSIWSEADRLTDDNTRHWTHREHPLVSLIRVDGKPFRLMGKEPADVPAFPQVGLRVLPTRSVYDFDDGHVHVTMTFTTAALPHDLELLARPLSYITWEVKSVDGPQHNVSIFDSTSALLAVNQPTQAVQWTRDLFGDVITMRVGTVAQTLLTPPGDDTRIDWGYAYAAAPASPHQDLSIGEGRALAAQFAQTGKLSDEDDRRQPRPANDAAPAMAFAFHLGQVGAQPVSRHMFVAYDEIYAIKYMGQRLRPYWNKDEQGVTAMLRAAEKDYDRAMAACAKFDDELMADLTKAGGPRYATMGALAYRQCFAACGLAADANKQPLLFTKENTSNGDIATVDVFFPMDPQMLFFSPALAKATLVPVLTYAASPRWKWPNAPHDLGTYPIARGTDDGGEGMPVEESGNMLILCAAIAHADGNADFVAPWWDKLTQWAQYLEQYGLDPENQLCTDDFMGHLAHNANLSVKAILGLAAYADLCHLRGDEANARKYMDLAKADAAHWVKVAADGDHSRLAFDKPNTWSQKYNLVWDRILGYNVFPADVARTEIAFYKTQLQPLGLPLDSRTKLTKTDWTFWSATMAESQDDFEALTNPILDYLNQTTARDPFADSYETNKVQSGGMHARPVIGGVFIKALSDPQLWKKYAARDTLKPGNWAPMPKAPTVTTLISTSEREPQTWSYTTTKPPANWAAPDFDASSWKQGPAGFGTKGTPGAVVNTTWNTGDIWIRREVTLPAAAADPHDLQWLVYHDEDVEIFVNGTPAGTEAGFVNAYDLIECFPQAKALLKPGAKVVIAAHCHQTEGGQGIDVGLVDVKP